MGSAPHTNPGFGGQASSFAHWRIPMWEDVFSRTTRARIRTLVGMSATYESGVPTGKVDTV